MATSASSSSSSVASLLAATFSVARAEQVAAEVGGGDKLEGFAWLRELLQRLQASEAALEQEKAARQNDRVNHEQRLNDIEDQFVAVSQSNTQLKVKLEAQEAKTMAQAAALSATEAKAAAAAAKSNEYATELQLQRQKASFAEQEKEVLASAADRKQTAIDELRDELAAARQAAAEKAQAASGEVASLFAQRSDAALRAKLEFTERERDLLRDSAAHLEERLARQTEQLFKTKEGLTARNKELEALIPHRDAELASLTQRAQAMEKEAATAAAALEAARATMRTMQQEHSGRVESLSQKAAKYEELAGNLETSLREAEELVQSLRTRHEQYREATAARQAEDRELLQTFERDALAKNATIDELRGRVRRLENDVAVGGQARLQRGGSSSSSSSSSSSTAVEPSAMIQRLVDHTGSGTLSDWYERIVTAEKERDESVKEKEQLKRLMDNILASIEKQGPAMRTQAEDLKRALESQQELADQIHEIDADNQRLRAENADFKNVETRYVALQKTTAALEESNRGLLWAAEGGGRVKPTSDAMQQALTAAAAGASAVAELSEAVRRHIPEYTSVAELTVKHTQLLQAYHEVEQRLIGRTEEEKERGELEKFVEQVRRELTGVVAARARSEDQVRALTQQRDAMRAALANKDRSYLLQHRGAAVAGSSDAGSPANLPQHPQLLAAAAADSSPAGGGPSPRHAQAAAAQAAARAAAAEAQTSTLRRNLQMTQETFAEYKKRRVVADEEQGKLLRAARAEANAKARDLSVAERNVDIYRERVSELKAAVAAARQEAREEKEKHARTFEGLLGQQTAANKTALAREQDQVELAGLRGEAAALKSRLALREAECARLQARAAELEQQLKSQASLLDKVQSIESAVASQKEAALARLTQERDDARRAAADRAAAVEVLRTDVQRVEAAARAEAKDRAAEAARRADELRAVRDAAAASAAELAAAREKHAALAAQHDALQSHLGGLKRRQSIRANAAAGIIGGSGDGDAAATAAAAGGGGGGNDGTGTGTAQLSLAVLDLPDSQVAAEAAATIARQATDIRELQVLLKSTEDAFESQQATLDTQETNLKALEAHGKELEAELAAKAAAATAAEAKAAEAAQTLAAAAEAARQAEAELKEQLQAAERRVASCDEREGALRESIQEHKEAAAVAQERYRHEHKEHERDMQLLEAAQADLATVRAELADLKVSTATAVAQAESVAASKTAEAEALAKRLAARDQEVAEIEAQNALLNRQMAALDAQIERARDASLDVTRESRPEDWGIASSSSSSGAEGVDASAPAEEAAAEVSRLKAMLKFHRDKHAVVQTKLDLQTKHVDELQRRVRSLEASLREAEAAAATAATSSSSSPASSSLSSPSGAGGVSTSAEHAQLLADVRQLHILHESNEQLRFQLKKAQAEAAAATAKLADAEARLRDDPRDAKIRQLTAAVADAERRVRDAEADRKVFQAQAQNVVAQIDMVDPAQHAALQAQLETAQRAAAAAATRMEEQQRQAAAKLREATLAEKAEKDAAAKFRDSLRRKNAELGDKQKELGALQARAAAAEAKLGQSQQQVQGLKKQLVATALAASANAKARAARNARAAAAGVSASSPATGGGHSNRGAAGGSPASQKARTPAAAAVSGKGKQQQQQQQPKTVAKRKLPASASGGGGGGGGADGNAAPATKKPAPSGGAGNRRGGGPAATMITPGGGANKVGPAVGRNKPVPLALQSRLGPKPNPPGPASAGVKGSGNLAGKKKKKKQQQQQQQQPALKPTAKVFVPKGGAVAAVVAGGVKGGAAGGGGGGAPAPAPSAAAMKEKVRLLKLAKLRAQKQQQQQQQGNPSGGAAAQ